VSERGPDGERPDVPAGAGNGLVEVRFPGYPLDWHRRLQEHYDELMREFALIALGSDEGDQVPRRLLDLVYDLTSAYAPVTSEPQQVRDAAIERGERVVDLVYRVPVVARDAATALRDMLDEADEFCRDGDLLTLATPPDVAAFRRWYFGEFVRQVEGGEPTRWQPPGGPLRR